MAESSDTRATLRVPGRRVFAGQQRSASRFGGSATGARIVASACVVTRSSAIACRPCSPASSRSPSTASIRAVSGRGRHPRRACPRSAIVGLADAAVREARERVRAALLNSGFEFPRGGSPRTSRRRTCARSGPGFDLALAVGAARRQRPVPRPTRSTRWAVFGELSLGGELRPAAARWRSRRARVRAGLAGSIVAARARGRGGAGRRARGRRASTTCARSPTLLDGGALPPPRAGAGRRRAAGHGGPDLADVRGHELPLRALEIAAAGGHNLLLEGPPGAGKTMLARRLPSLLPPLDARRGDRGHAHPQRRRAPAGAAGSSRRGPSARRTTRSRRRGSSAAARAGAGRGDASRTTACCSSTSWPSSRVRASRRCASRSRTAASTIVRGQRALCFPTRFMLVARDEPVPVRVRRQRSRRARCGEPSSRATGGGSAVRCSTASTCCVDRRAPERGRAAPRPRASPPTRARARARRARAPARAARGDRRAAATRRWTPRCCADASRSRPSARGALAQRTTRGGLSARGHDRVLRVARTIADLGGATPSSSDDVLLALAVRSRDARRRRRRGGMSGRRTASRRATACLRRAWLVARLAGHIELAVVARDAVAGGARARRRRADRGARRRRRSARRGASTSAFDAPGPRAPRGERGRSRCAAATRAIRAPLRELRRRRRRCCTCFGDAARLAACRRARPRSRSSARAARRRTASSSARGARSRPRGGGVTVVSGMALGDRRRRARGALEAGGLTVAVLAGGAERAYPASKRGCTADRCGGRGRRPSCRPGARRGAGASRAQPHHRRARARRPSSSRRGERSGSLITAGLAPTSVATSPPFRGRDRAAARRARTH